MSFSEVSAYGLWPLVIINAAVFILFAFSFPAPLTSTGKRLIVREKLFCRQTPTADSIMVVGWLLESAFLINIKERL